MADMYNLKNEIVKQETVNRFLESLREDGKINMFGAHPYVAEMFKLSIPDARKMTAAWMQTPRK